MTITQIPFLPHPNSSGYQARIPTMSQRFLLSIVAGDFFYSEPRLDLADPSEYTAVELAIFDQHNDGQWASYNALEEAGIFNILEDHGEYYEPSDEPESSVFAYLPLDKVLKVIAEC